MSKEDGRVIMTMQRDPVEYATLQGIRYIASHVFTSLSAGDSVYYFMDFSNVSKRVVFIDFNVATDGQCLVTFYKSPTLSANGTEITAMNTNAKHPNENQLKVYHAPTITSNGTQAFQVYVALGNRGSRVMKEILNYRILNTDVLVEITNVSGSSMAYGSVVFDWKEE